MEFIYQLINYPINSASLSKYIKSTEAAFGNKECTKDRTLESQFHGDLYDRNVVCFYEVTTREKKDIIKSVREFFR